MSNMGPDLELKERSYISREVSGNKKPMAVMKELENNQMNCAKNCEDKNLDMQVGTIEQTEVEINNTLEGTNSGHEGWDPALTESSSSFDSDGTSFSDNEVSSELFDDALPEFPFDDCSDLFRIRKKKLTTNWKKYIGPLMWRCKWVELQIKKFESQAQKYDREIDEYNRRKSLESCISENINTKSLPFNAQSQGKAVMKRKKRRRAEDLDNIESYISCHNLFSYFENKKTAADAACADGICGNQGADKTSNGTSEIRVDEEFLSRDFKDGGDSLEQIFWKIGLMQCKVSELKTRAHKVLSENALRVCSTENLSSLMPCNNNTLTSSTEKQAFPLNNDPNLVPTQENDTKMVGDIVTGEIESDNSDIKMVDVSMPETPAAALGDGEVTPALDNIKIINSTANGGSSKNPSGAILMYNRRAKTNQSKSKEVDIVITQNPDRASQDHESSVVVPFRQDPEASTPKIRSISEMMSASTSGTTSNKRRRATRKARVWKVE